MRRILFIALCLLAAGLFQTATAQTPVPLDDGRHEYALGPHLAVFEDRDRKLAIDDISAPGFADRFKPVNSATPNFGYSPSAYWFRLTIRSAGVRPTDWMLNIAYPALDNVELYAPAETPGGGFSIQRNGDGFPFTQRAIANRNLVFQVTVPPRGETTYYIRLVTTGTAQLPATLLTFDRFQASDHNSQMVLGVYYGILLVMIAYNLFIFLATRERSYGVYVLYIFGFGLSVFSLDGLSFEYLWPNSVWWNNHALPFLAGFTSLWLALFTKLFLSTAERLPRCNFALNVGCVCGILNMIAGLTLPETISPPVTGFLILGGGTMCVTVGVISFFTGYRPAKFYLLAMSMLFIGTTIFALHAGGTLPSTFLTRHGMALGSALEVVLLSLGLADRINALQKEKESAEAEATVKEKDAEILRLRGVELAGALNETEKKNKELADANAQIERKNRELDKKIAEIEAAQRQADRMFLALADALPGTVIEGKYQLGDKIGAGGFGVVFRGTNLADGTPIAVKVFRPMAGNDSADAAERFRREGTTLCRIQHPNAVRVYDSGISSDGIAYIVMELLVGTSLNSELRENGKVSLRRTARIIRSVCEALSSAHASGIIHRDIKPDNVFLHRSDEGEIVKVVDFGIAKLMKDDTAEDTEENAALTRTGGVIGTPQYIAPERLNGNPYDGKSDVYSVGVMLYQMLCGTVPFQATGNNVIKLIMSHLNDPPPPMRNFNRDIPPPVETLVMRALAKKPTERPTAKELGESLSAIAAAYGGHDTGEFTSTGPSGADISSQETIDVCVMNAPGFALSGDRHPAMNNIDENAATVAISYDGHPVHHPNNDDETVVMSTVEENLPTPGSLIPVTPNNPDENAPTGETITKE
jgi:serine/threonine protein kinase